MPLFKRKGKDGQASKTMTGRSVTEKIPYTSASGKKDTASFGMGNTKFKSYSDDKKYVTKGKTNASGAVTSMKSRRTVKGALTGAPRAKKNM